MNFQEKIDLFCKVKAEKQGDRFMDFVHIPDGCDRELLKKAIIDQRMRIGRKIIAVDNFFPASLHDFVIAFEDISFDAMHAKAQQAVDDIVLKRITDALQ